MDHQNHIVEVDLEQLEQSKTFYHGFVKMIATNIVAIIAVLLLLLVFVV